jgi:hypothetical protein
MKSLIRYNLFLFTFFSIILYFAISKILVFGVYTQLFNIFTILVLLVMGIYYPRFSRGINEVKTIKIKLMWMTAFLVFMFGFKFFTPFISDSIFCIIVVLTCFFFVKELKRRTALVQ